ncbi:uncharacterized protein [Montipora capricornis]|uniref:uncharacterized protein n=1 Tax=Montipora capricornis TaxID=246305 RepID=UPI0035F1E55D
MSSDSNDSFESDSSESSIDFEESGDEVEVVTGEHAPYQDEPLARDGEQDEESEDADLDGLTPSVLEARFERRVAVSEWCKCKQCSDETLADALEFRCCREVTNARRQLVFDGSIETISCITQHEDYSALTNRTVLLQVAPLLRDQNGRAYRRRTGVHENEFVRAVAYRWVVRWLCGYMGHFQLVYIII